MSISIDKSLWNTIKHKECWIIAKQRDEGHGSSSTQCLIECGEDKDFFSEFDTHFFFPSEKEVEIKVE